MFKQDYLLNRSFVWTKWFYLPGVGVRRCSVKKMSLKISQNSQENTCVGVSFLIKLQSETCNFIKKETPTHVFSSEFGEMFKNFFFKEHLRANASANDFNFIFSFKCYRTTIFCCLQIGRKIVLIQQERILLLYNSHKETFRRKFYLQSTVQNQKNTCSKLV